MGKTNDWDCEEQDEKEIDDWEWENEESKRFICWGRLWRAALVSC